MMAMGLGELIVMLALGMPWTAGSVAASNPILGLASSMFLKGPGLMTAGAFFFTVRGSSPSVAAAAPQGTLPVMPGQLP
jgi:hypothetical protein